MIIGIFDAEFFEVVLGFWDFVDFIWGLYHVSDDVLSVGEGFFEGFWSFVGLLDEMGCWVLVFCFGAFLGLCGK